MLSSLSCTTYFISDEVIFLKAVIQYLRGRGYNCVNDGYYTLIALWQQWYRGLVPSVHNYTQYNGRRRLRRTRKTLGMAKTVAEDWASLALNEKVQISVNKASAQKRIDEVLRENDFRVRANQLLELTYALGTGAMVEYLDGERVRIDYIRAGMIYPLRWENGTITECAFASEQVAGKEKRIYLNIHRLEQGRYVIENHLFRESGGAIGELTLPEGVQAEVRTGSAVPRFQILKPNIANNLDPEAPFGLSVYANALDQLEHVDLIFDSYSNEFRLGKKRITVPITMARMQMEQDGTVTPVFDDNDTEFFAVPQDGQNPAKIEEHNMELRADAHEKGIQTALNLLAWKCGFGTKRYNFQDGQIKTATEIISDKSDLYQNLKKHELLLENALVGMVDAIADMLHLGTLKTTVCFDDSIIEDSGTERERDRQDVRDGLMQKWEYRVKWYGEDEITAKSMTEPQGDALNLGW